MRTLILVIQGGIPGFFLNNSLQYHDLNNDGLGLYLDYQELFFLDLFILKIQDLLYMIINHSYMGSLNYVMLAKHSLS